MVLLNILSLLPSLVVCLNPEEVGEACPSSTCDEEISTTQQWDIGDRYREHTAHYTKVPGSGGDTDPDCSLSISGKPSFTGGYLFGASQVSETPSISGGYISDSIVKGQASVSEEAVISSNSSLSGNAKVYGKAEVSNSSVSGSADISGNASLSNSSASGGSLSGYASFSNSSISAGNVYGTANISSNSRISGGTIYGGNISNSRISGGTISNSSSGCMNVSYNGVCNYLRCCKKACRWGYGIEDHVTCEGWTTKKGCFEVSNVKQEATLNNVTMTGGEVWNGAELSDITISGGKIGSYAEYTLSARNSWGNHCTKITGGCNGNGSGSLPTYKTVSSRRFNNKTWGLTSFGSSTVLSIDLKHSRGFKQRCIKDYKYIDATDWKGNRN